MGLIKPEKLFLDFSSAIERYGRQEAAIARISNPSNEEVIALGKKLLKLNMVICFKCMRKL